MAMLPSPAAGLLSGLMAGNQARIQREMLQLQKDEAKRHRDMQWMERKTTLRQVRAETTPDNYDLHESILSGHRRLAADHGLSWPEDLNMPSRPSGPHTPSPQAAGGGPDYAQQGFGSPGAQRTFHMEQKANELKQIEMDREIGYAQNWAEDGDQFVHDFPKEAIASGNIPEFLAHAVSESLARYGPQRGWEALQRVVPLLNAVEHAQQTAAFAAMKSTEELDEYKQKQFESLRTTLGKLFAGRLGMDWSTADVLMADMVAQDRVNFAAALEYGGRAINEANVLGGRSFSGIDAFEAIMDNLGETIGLIPAGGRKWRRDPTTEQKAAAVAMYLGVHGELKTLKGEDGKTVFDYEGEWYSLDDMYARYFMGAELPDHLEMPEPPAEPEGTPGLRRRGEEGEQPRKSRSLVDLTADWGASTRQQYPPGEKWKQGVERARSRSRAMREEAESQRDPRFGVIPRRRSDEWGSVGTGLFTNEWTDHERELYHQGLMNDMPRREP